MINQVDLIKAYYKFIKGKRKKKDVQEFILNAEYELLNLFQEIHHFYVFIYVRCIHIVLNIF